jgi:hypothetical protein
LQDKRIGLVAFAILCDVRSKGLNWQLRIREVRQRFSWGDQATRTAMRELTNAGWAQLERERGKGGAILGSYYVIRKMPVTETAVTRVSVNRSLIEDGPIERTEAANRDLGSKESLKSKAGAGAHEAFSWSVLKEGAAEIVTRFNKTFVPKGAQPLNKSTPDVRRILRHCGWGDYTAFEKAALADHANWRTRFKTRSGEYKRPGFVALWHKYKSLPKPKRVVRFADKDIDGLADWRNELRDESNALFRADKAGSRKRRAEIEKQIQAIEAEWECRTGRNAEELRMKHGAARSEREHEAIKAAPIIPWLNGSESKVA